MFDTARESSLSQAISNINAYLLNANTDNSLQANYRCGLPELIVAENPTCSTTPTHNEKSAPGRYNRSPPSLSG